MLDREPGTRSTVPGEPTGLAVPTLSGPPRDGRDGGHAAGESAVETPSRVDLLRVLTGLRHLPGSTEPGRVFSELAGVCVPALCDEVIITIEEAGGHRYRIRQPATTPAPVAGPS